MLPVPKGRHEKNDRLFLEAVCWIVRTGALWRDLPPDFGSWKTVYNRYSRWVKKGIFIKFSNFLKKDRDHEWNVIDGSIIRAHRNAASALGGHDKQGLGRSFGGLKNSC